MYMESVCIAEDTSWDIRRFQEQPGNVLIIIFCFPTEKDLL